MTSTGQNFTLYQGDNKQIIITIRNSSGAVEDLTGYSAVWCVHNQTPADIVFQKTTSPGEGITIPDPTNGQIVIELDQEDTANLTPKNYGHQAEVQDSSGHHTTVTTGYIKVLRSITHHEL